MSVLDDFLEGLKLNKTDSDYDDYDEYDDDYDDDDDIVNEPPRAVEYDDGIEQFPSSRRNAAKTNKVPQQKNTTRKTTSNSDVKVCVIKPKSMEDSCEITDNLLLNRTVVLNLEGLETELAQRITDFASGSCYAIKGNLQKITQFIIIVTPPSVGLTGDLSGDFQSLLFDVYDDSRNAGFNNFPR